MKRSIMTPILTVLLAVLALFLWTRHNYASAATVIPDPAVDETLASQKGQQTVVVSGGCFWGIQAVFQHVKGVTRATSGYSGGTVKNPDYEQVSSGTTGHAESVEIVYDPSKITLGQLLKVFFSVAHDPTELNRQGPDTGTQYRSIIFFSNTDQQRIAQSYVDQLNQSKVFSQPIVTQIVPLKAFYRAEDYHQNYATEHLDSPYIAMFDLPKLKNLQQQFPSLYVAKP
ncbi:MAG: peptide-methionine (S)-S-oxide reductase MsrA [Candidatus Acidiferrales bacterium]